MAGLNCDRPGKIEAEESVAGEERSCAAKSIECSEGSEKRQGEAAAPATKKMWRLPKEEIEWILAQANEPVCAEFRDLKRANPSLVPSPEEEKDKAMVLLYACARDAYEDEAKFAEFQAWVRSEYAAKGSVEVDYDYYGKRAEATRLSEEAREVVFRNRDLSSDSEDDELLRHLKRTVRGFVLLNPSQFVLEPLLRKNYSWTKKLCVA